MPNQSMLDVVISEYGALDAAMAFCAANDTPISSLPDPGTVFALTPTPGDNAVLRYLRERGVRIGTANIAPAAPEPGMAMRWVLVPRMDADLSVYDFVIEGEPFCDITYSAADEFLNVNELMAAWPDLPNEQIRSTQYGWYASTPPFVQLPVPSSYIGDMPGRSLQFSLTDPLGLTPASYVVWSEPVSEPDTGLAVRFVDVNGNTAVWSPVSILFYEPEGGGAYTIYPCIGKITITPEDWTWDDVSGTMHGVVGYDQGIGAPPIMELVVQKLQYRVMGGEYSTLATAIGPGEVELALAPGIYEIMIISGHRATYVEDAQVLNSYYSVVVEVAAG